MQTRTGYLVRRWVGYVGLLALWLTGSGVWAGTGWIELRQVDMPITLTESGSYRLVEPLSLTDGNTHGITVIAPDVYLDLNGFTLTGQYDATLDGIHIAPSAINTVVENGIVVRWGEDGIDAGVEESTSTGCVFRALQITENAWEGLEAGRSAMVEECVVMANGRYNADPDHEEGSGILVGQGSLVSRCTVYENHGHGILVRSAGVVQDCLIFRNDHDGIHAGQNTLVLRCTVQGERHNGDGVEVDGGSLVVDTSSCFNSDDGMKTRSSGRSVFFGCITSFNESDGINVNGPGALLIENSAVDNDDDGLYVDGSALVVRNSGHFNGMEDGGTPGGGVRVGGTHSRVTDNHTVGNEYGVDVPGSKNLIMGNSALDNVLDDFNGLGNDRAGTTRTQPGNAEAWDQFAY